MSVLPVISNCPICNDSAAWLQYEEGMFRLGCIRQGCKCIPTKLYSWRRNCILEWENKPKKKNIRDILKIYEELTI